MATTEIYTYGHTLSQHDARPVWSKWNTLEMICQRPPTRMRASRSAKNVAPIEHSTRAKAVTGPANSIETMRSLRGSPRLAGEGRAPTMGKYSAIEFGRAHVCTPVTNAELVSRLPL